MKLLFRTWLALWPFFLAVFLPYVTPPAHYINLVWGYLYGLGFEFVHLLGGIQTPWAMFGFLVWPLLVSALLFWAGDILWRRTGPSGARRIAILVLISSFVSVTDHFMIANRSLWFPNYSVYVAVTGP